MCAAPAIPEFITVHLGRPEASAQNVTIPFPDYMKNVASSEIFPTWPESALRANIYAQTSFALNRVYTEWYRSKGFDFDITNSTAYDQSFVFGRDIFNNISEIVDELFNDYIRRIGFIEPLFAQYCNGTTVTCDGLSQWGTVPLAKEGYVPYSILTYYYGENIEIVRNAPVVPNVPSFPGVLRRGSTGNDVKVLQIRLNRISRNYPSIPKIASFDGIFGPITESAVQEFQRIFRLTQDGIVGYSTWYRIIYIYNSVKRLAELNSEGETILGYSAQYPDAISLGDQGEKVRVLQFFLLVIANFYQTVSFVNVTGIFDEPTREAVVAFQLDQGLEPTGVVDANTWYAIYEAFRGITDVIPEEYFDSGTQAFPGYTLIQGMRGPYVRLLQEYLSAVAVVYPSIPAVPPTGQFGSRTKDAVTAFQKQFGLPPTGAVDATTWDILTDVYDDVVNGMVTKQGQFPGRPLKEGDSDFK